MSANTALAVSGPPAPRPEMLSRPACFVSSCTMLSVPETARVPFSGTSRGPTRTSPSATSPMSRIVDPLHLRVLERVRVLVEDVRQDDTLQRGVDPLHVEGRIGLGDPEVLCLREHVLVVEPLGGHPRENEVRRPVEDAAGRGHLAVEVVDRREDRDRAADRGLEQDRSLGVGFERPDVVVALGDRSLVRQHGVSAACERPFDV